MHITRTQVYFFALFMVLQYSCKPEDQNALVKIDRFKLVSRHNVKVNSVDTLESLSVGNGEFAFTVDVTGLQTFPEKYENGLPLNTQSQWGWHSFPNDQGFKISDVAEEFESCNDRSFPVATQHRDGRKGAATHWLRTNPHRLHLGQLGFLILKKDGSEIQIEDVAKIEQKLDLWTGAITSYFEIEGVPVKVITIAQQEQDLISFKIESPLLTDGRLKLKIRFPYGNDCHTCPGYDWDHPEKHESIIEDQDDFSLRIHRMLDSSRYEVTANWGQKTMVEEPEKHLFIISPMVEGILFEGMVGFSDHAVEIHESTFAQVFNSSKKDFEEFWQNGGVIDFSQCLDPRAKELERRVVLSQYLTKIQCSGRYPPQETGLTCNSWYGKFHLEMHWWHGVHFALWNRLELLEKSLPWYLEVMEEARNTATWQGFAGVRWQKMTGPEGRISPSGVGEFLAWQQPHPIYFAELVYRQKPDEITLATYRDIVFETAEFMASFAQFDSSDHHFHLCHPLIPAQEIFPATETDDPPFELAYWHFALKTAQEWRKRLKLEPNGTWERVVEHLAPLPQHNELYLPCARAIEAYTDEENRRDHPIVLGAYGMLPWSEKIDTVIMGSTFEEIMRKWNWQSTWGWDYPMIAMTAARLGKPQQAIDALFMDVQKNTYLNNGHNYQDKRLRLYLPGNGGLLAAVAMMAVGWDGSENENPGFPADGQWNVRWENLNRMP